MKPLDQPHPMTWSFVAGMLGGNAGWAATIGEWASAAGFAFVSVVLYAIARSVKDEEKKA